MKTYIEFAGVGFEVDHRGLIFLPADSNAVRRPALMNELLDEDVERKIVRLARDVEQAIS